MRAFCAALLLPAAAAIAARSSGMPAPSRDVGFDQKLNEQLPLDLPFKDEQFDFVYETSLCHVSDKQVVQAITELRRVIRKGL